MVTVSYKISGQFTSAGTAYDLQLPIETVQTNTSTTNHIATTTNSQPSLVKFTLTNYTQWAVASKTIRSEWFRGMSDANALLTTTNGTPAAVPTSITSNGFTIINGTPMFGVEIVSITKANPGVVTFRGPGFTPGQGIPAFATGDTFKFNGVAGSSGTDWSALNGNVYTLTKISPLSFSFATDTSGYTGTYTASSGIAYRLQTASGTLIPPLNVANVGVRIGTSVVGADGDVMFWEAEMTDDFRNLGDLGV